MGSWKPAALVFGTSAVVLTVEVIAARLMAPYVGVSQETFTGIIGTVLAGIAFGAAAGGTLADRHGPDRLIGPALVVGGALTWASLPLVRLFGPTFGSIGGPVGIVALTAVSFLLPCTVLSAISPMVAKMKIESLAESGSVVGRMSAAGTFGALAGTFVSGFILVATMPSQWIIVGVGALSLLAGLWLMWQQRDRSFASFIWPFVLVSGVGATTIGAPCDLETSYSCVRVLTDDDRSSGRRLILDRTQHAYVDLDDPTFLEMWYAQVVAAVIDAGPAGSLDVVHVGGGGFSMPRWLDATRPGSSSVVLEIDGDLLDIAVDRLGFDDSHTETIIGDARMTMRQLDDGSADVVIGDAFASASVPWHLTTVETMDEVTRILRPGGTYVMNVIDGGESRYVAAQLATLAERFAHVAVVVPSDGIPSDRPVNQILVASDSPLELPDLAGIEARFISGLDVAGIIGDARPLTDAFAPVDHLVMG